MAHSGQRSIFDYLEGDVPKLVKVFKNLHNDRTPNRTERNLLRRSISKLTVALQSQLRRRTAKKKMLTRRRHKRSIEMLHKRKDKEDKAQPPLTGGPESILAKFLDTTYDTPIGKASGQRRSKKNTRRARKRQKAPPQNTQKG